MKENCGLSFVGRVYNADIIKQHRDPQIRRLAGERVAIYPETLEPIIGEDGEKRGCRVDVMPLDIPNYGQPVSLRIGLIETDKPLAPFGFAND